MLVSHRHAKGSHQVFLMKNVYRCSYSMTAPIVIRHCGIAGQFRFEGRCIPAGNSKGGLFFSFEENVHTTF